MNPLLPTILQKKRIIGTGICTQCGACEAACPVRALHVEGEKVEHIYDCSKDLDLCPICYEICPHSEAQLLRSLKFVADEPVKSEALGYYRKIVLLKLWTPKYVSLVTVEVSLLCFLNLGLKTKVFDSAVVS